MAPSSNKTPTLRQLRGRDIRKYVRGSRAGLNWAPSVPTERGYISLSPRKVRNFKVTQLGQARNLNWTTLCVQTPMISLPRKPIGLPLIGRVPERCIWSPTIPIGFTLPLQINNSRTNHPNLSSILRPALSFISQFTDRYAFPLHRFILHFTFIYFSASQTYHYTTKAH